MADPLVADGATLLPQLVTLRQDLHRHPELLDRLAAAYALGTLRGGMVLLLCSTRAHTLLPNRRDTGN